MLSYASKEKLSNLFEIMVDNEQKIESMKQILVQSLEYDISIIFGILDVERKGFISFSDLQKFIQINDVTMSKADIYDIFSEFDIFEEEKISFQVLTKILSPQNEQMNKQTCLNSQQKYFANQKLTYEQEWSFIRFIQQTSQNLRRLQYEKQDLQRQIDFSVRNCFQTIDKNNKGYATIQNIYDFQLQNRHQLNQNQILILFRIITNSYEHRLFFEQFQSIFQKNPKKYPYYDTFQSQEISPPKNQSSILQRQRSGNLSVRETDLVFLYFKQLVINERAIEQKKIELAQQFDFNEFDAFKIFDLHCNGMVTFKQFCQALNQFGVFFHDGDYLLLFNQLDRSSNGILEFNQFLPLIEPWSSKYQSILKNNRPLFINSHHDLSQETNRLFRSLLSLQIQKEIDCEEFAIKLENNSFFNYQLAFRHLDVSNKGYLLQEDFRFFADENDFYLNQQDLSILFNRMDKNNDSNIKFQEFLYEIQPKLE